MAVLHAICDWMQVDSSEKKAVSLRVAVLQHNQREREREKLQTVFRQKVQSRRSNAM